MKSNAVVAFLCCHFLFWIICFYRIFCHRTESDLFLIINTDAYPLTSSEVIKGATVVEGLATADNDTKSVSFVCNDFKKRTAAVYVFRDAKYSSAKGYFPILCTMKQPIHSSDSKKLYITTRAGCVYTSDWSSLGPDSGDVLTLNVIGWVITGNTFKFLGSSNHGIETENEDGSDSVTARFSIDKERLKTESYMLTFDLSITEKDENPGNPIARQELYYR